MSVSVNGTNGITFNDGSAQNTAATGFGFKNRIINGACMIDQRNAGAAVTTSGSYPVDRFSVENSSDGAFSAQQDSSAPAGFVNSLKVTVTTADASIGATQLLQVQHKIEGLNIADLGWGTANAQPVTLSFWVRSSLTGSFGGAIINSANNRSYPFSYTISAANTWEQKSVTIAGDTSGTWLTTNGVGIKVNFGLGIGSTYSGTAGSWAGALYLSSTGAVAPLSTLNSTWYVTGVQLEKGSTATSFDYRPYGTELALCQRYYYKNTRTGTTYADYGIGLVSGASAGYALFVMPVEMRSAATASISGDVTFNDAGVNSSFSSITATYTSKNTVSLGVNTGGGLTTGRAMRVICNNSSTAVIDFSAEL